MVCVRHVLEGHVVFQFNCTNTVREQVLEDVSVTVDLADAVSTLPVWHGCWLLAVADKATTHRCRCCLVHGCWGAARL